MLCLLYQKLAIERANGIPTEIQLHKPPYHVDSSPFTPVGLSAKVVILNPCRSPSCGLWTL